MADATRSFPKLSPTRRLRIRRSARGRNDKQDLVLIATLEGLAIAAMSFTNGFVSGLLVLATMLPWLATFWLYARQR